MKSLCVLATASVVFGAAPPEMASEWTSTNYGTTIMLFQGGTHNDTSQTACCDNQAVNCKVQTEGLAGVFAADMPNNRTSFIVGAQNLITLGAPHNMQFTAKKDNTGKWSCQEYCPFQDVTNPIALNPKAKDLGKVVLKNGKSYEHWQWNDDIFGVVKMDSVDFYVDQSGDKPVPYYQVMDLTPFGGAEIAVETQTFNSFTAGKVDPDAFDVPNLSSCPVSDNCQQDGLRTRFFSQVLPRQTLAARTKMFPKKKAEARKVEAAGNFTWPVDFSAFESQGMIANQGGVPSQDGKSTCCHVETLAQCQVQIQYQAGQKYYDYTNQRTRFESAGQVVVDLFDKHKSMLVVQNGTHEVCQEYCPMDPADTMDKGSATFLDDSAYDAGQAKFHGLSCEHWLWNDTIFGKIVMETSDFYADTSGPSVVPVGRVDNLTPFGVQFATVNVGWDKFKAGAQPADKFDIQGVDSCPLSQNCGQSFWQTHRAASRNKATFAKYATPFVDKYQ
mmetsp:Transcript_43544/g.85247  ORF Transcript_43544/g.85247 Transcript_43544/m.85247 type:complete len:501 (+) Transcript_43544:22-1524(+)